MGADQLRARLAGHAGAVVFAGYALGATTPVTAGADGTVRLWNPITGGQTAVLDARAGPITDAELDGTGTRLIAGYRNGTARVWNLKTRQAGTTLTTGRGAIAAVRIAAHADRALTRSADNAVELWDAQTGRRLAILAAAERTKYLRPYHDLQAISADGSVAAAVSGRGLVHRDPQGRARTLHAYSSARVAFSPDGRRLASVGDSPPWIGMWDARTGARRASFGAEAALQTGFPSVSPTEVAFSTDGRLLATGYFDGSARLWALPGGRLLGVMRGHTGFVTSATFSPGNREIVTAGNDAASW